MGPSVPHPASAGKFAVWFHRKDYLSYFFFVAAIQTEFKVLKHENIIYFSDPDCEGHRCEGNGGYEHPPYDGEESQDEDSCSEHSSSTSTSTNQKEGKYCDCCYCEFFGHGGVRHACLCKHIDLRLTSCWCFVFLFFLLLLLLLFFPNDSFIFIFLLRTLIDCDTLCFIHSPQLLLPVETMQKWGRSFAYVWQNAKRNSRNARNSSRW